MGKVSLQTEAPGQALLDLRLQANPSCSPGTSLLGWLSYFTIWLWSRPLSFTLHPLV